MCYFMKYLTAALIFEKGKILLVRNIKNGLRVEPPGGKREDYESLDECVVRECLEELGVKVNIKKVFGDYKTNSPEGDFLVRMYFVDIVEGVPSINDGEKDKFDGFDYYGFDDLLRLREEGILVPNLCDALGRLKLEGFFDENL